MIEFLAFISQNNILNCATFLKQWSGNSSLWEYGAEVVRLSLNWKSMDENLHT